MSGRFLLTLFLALSLCLVANAQLVREVRGENKEYKVLKTENLIDIAQKFTLAIEHIAFSNGISEKATKVVQGATLTIPGQRVLPASPPKDGLVLNIPERGIYKFSKGKFDQFLPVSVGRPPGAKTIPGNFHIIEKIKDPTWYPPAWADSQKPVPPGPDNPLGNRWIGISSHMVGIHGTDDPLNVGAPVTHGCIRCYPHVVEKLFDQVEIGQPVRIEYEVAKLGKLPNGETAIVTFHDIYGEGEGNTLKAALELITKAGYGSLSEDKKFLNKLNLNLGIPISLDAAKQDMLARAAQTDNPSKEHPSQPQDAEKVKSPAKDPSTL